MAYKKKIIYDRGRLIIRAFCRSIPYDWGSCGYSRLMVAILERAVLDLFDDDEQRKVATWFKRGFHCRYCWLLGVDPEYLIRLIDELFDYHAMQGVNHG